MIKIKHVCLNCLKELDKSNSITVLKDQYILTTCSTCGEESFVFPVEY